MALQKILSFLTDLSKNNNREWFDENRDRYLEVKELFEHFTDLLIHEVGQFDKAIHGLVPKDCTFRIFRDVRFAKDKRPYKTNFGSYIVQGGKKSGFSGYYFHLAPDECFVAGGTHTPTGENLRKIRLDIVSDPEFFKDIIHHKDFIENYGELKGEKVKTYPRGFDKNFAELELIKHKQYFAYKSIPQKMLLSNKLVPEIIQSFKAIKPLNDFINDIISNE